MERAYSAPVRQVQVAKHCDKHDQRTVCMQDVRAQPRDDENDGATSQTRQRTSAGAPHGVPQGISSFRKRKRRESTSKFCRGSPSSIPILGNSVVAVYLIATALQLGFNPKS